MSGIVTEITLHQLEQAVLFERALRWAEIIDEEPKAAKHYNDSKKGFWKLAHKVDEEILEGEELVQHIIDYEKSHGGSTKIIDEFTHVLAQLKKIEKEHHEFDEQAKKVFSYFERGNIHEAHRLAEKVEAMEDQLDHELESLVLELEGFTAKAALDAEHTEQRFLEVLIIASAAGVIAFLALAWFIMRSIIVPLNSTKDYADALSTGNLDAPAPTCTFEDEIAEMMKSLTVFKENALETERLKKEQELAEQRAEIERKEVMLQLADQFDSQVGSTIVMLAEAAQQLQEASGNMEGTARQTEDSSNTVAAAAEETSSNVATVASATEEMTASAQEITTQIADVASKANLASDGATATSQKVDELNELVENIGEVVAAISEIAEQTNLLALNATIESARAGENGKGFAVVAEEVKKLATETGQKTSEIESRITKIQDATRESVSAMQNIITNIKDIDNASAGTASAVEEQNAVIQEITRNITEVSGASKEVAEVIGSVQTAAGETGQASQMLKTSSDDIAELSGNLEQSVSEFLEKIRKDNSLDGSPDTEASNDDGDDDNAHEDGLADAAE